MGEYRGTRARARFAALATAVALMAAGLIVPQAAHAADTPEQTKAELAAELKSYLATKKGSYSVSVRELGDQEVSLSLNGATRREPASTIKLFYAWAALRRVDRGTLSLDTRMNNGLSVATCLTVMIQISDNQCAIDLRKLLGSKNLNSLFKSEGYPNTTIVLDSKGNYVTKRTSTNDLALLLSRLERGELLSEKQTNEFQKRLRAQIWRQRITSGTEAGTVVGSKSGQLYVSTGMVEADTAIVYGPDSTYVLTAIGTHGASGTTIRGIASIVYRHLQAPIKVRASFPAAQYTTKERVKLVKIPGGSLVKYVSEGTAVQVIDSNRTWIRVKAGTSYGWVAYEKLRLRDEYRWP